MKHIILLIIITLFYSCGNKEEKIIPKTVSSKIPEWKHRVITKGDKEAYSLLWNACDEDNNCKDLLSYSMLMANKYDNQRAYYDVFEILCSTSADAETENKCELYNLVCLDSVTKKLAIEYFKKAIYHSEETASRLMLDYYNEGKLYPEKELFSDKSLIDKAKENIQHYP